MTVAALGCAALQRCSFLLSFKVRTPCSRTSFSFPPNRKPSFLSAIFCICHHVCPLVHPILPVTAFGWQFLYRGCVFVVTVFLLGKYSLEYCEKYIKE